MARPNLKQVATVFIVDSVEPCVAFWVDRFGFREPRRGKADPSRLRRSG